MNILSLSLNPPFFKITIQKCIKEIRSSAKKVEHHNYSSKEIRGKIEIAL